MRRGRLHALLGDNENEANYLAANKSHGSELTQL